MRVTSGFSPSEYGAGPPEENEAIAPLLLAAATVMAAGARARRVDRAGAEHVEVVAGGDHGHDPGLGGAVDRLHDDVARRRRSPARRARG